MAISQIDIATPAAFSLYTDTNIGGSTVDGIKSSSARVYYIYVDNTLNAAASYVKLFNLASGSTTVGTSVPDLILYVPASSVVTQSFVTAAAPGLVFGTALSAACTTAGGTAGTTAPNSAVTMTVAFV